MYNEIEELYEYCKGLKIPCKLEPLYDGYKLVLPNGGDFVQHSFSWGSAHGRVEPAIGCDFDYTACTLSVAKELVEEYYGQKEN
jgi:hypothetical protein